MLVHSAGCDPLTSEHNKQCSTSVAFPNSLCVQIVSITLLTDLLFFFFFLLELRELLGLLGADYIVFCIVGKIYKYEVRVSVCGVGGGRGGEGGGCTLSQRQLHPATFRTNRTPRGSRPRAPFLPVPKSSAFNSKECQDGGVVGG